MNKQHSYQKGFTLIEVMIALVVLLLGLLGVMGMQYYAVTGNASSREIRIATDIAGDMIEQMKATSYANLATGTDTPLAGLSTTISAGKNFTRAWWVVPNCAGLAANGNVCNAAAPACAAVPDGLVPVNVSSIRVRTCWMDKNNNPHAVTLDTARRL